MIDAGSLYVTSQVEPEDAASGFSCGKHPLDDYLRRHAVSNDRAGISRAYVLRRRESDPVAHPRRSRTCCRRSCQDIPCRSP